MDSGIPVGYSQRFLGTSNSSFYLKGSVKERSAFDDFPIRISPAFGPLPSIFGLNIATYIPCEPAGKPILDGDPLSIKNRRKLYKCLHQDFLHRESKIAAHQINRLPIDKDGIALMLEDIYKGCSLLPPHEVPTRPTLVRWDPARPLCLKKSCVVFDQPDVEKHVKTCWNGSSATTQKELWGSAV
ncbi:hypothetical protein BYT27DRAFT_6451296 [Phlegmacium glaucopus]|nr:hypothetical protein BYT27DRAFT_6451296 [Phlegmacium glaucopus]